MGNTTAKTNASPELEAVDARRLQVFLAAARSSSFAAAADQLNLVPSAVSHAIRTLEEEFECALFRRHGPRVYLTRAGQRLVPLADELLKRMARLRCEVASIKASGRHLRIMVPESFCSLMLPQVLPDFVECFPSAMLELVPEEVDAGKAVEALVSGGADLLIRYSVEEYEDTVLRTLFGEPLGMYVAPFHPLARTEEEGGAGTLTEYPLMVTSSAMAGIARELLERGGWEGTRVWELPSISSVRDLARVGQGVALLPERAAKAAVQLGEFTRLELATQGLSWTCSAYWPSRMELNWAAEVFMSLVTMEAQGELP